MDESVSRRPGPGILSPDKLAAMRLGRRGQ